MIRVYLSETERAECAEYSRTVLGRVYGPNYTGLESADRFFVGRCGELAVRKWAIMERLNFEETVNDLGIPDQQDFLFFPSAGPLRANVKTTLHPRGRYLMQPASQATRHEQDVYIGVNGTDNGLTVDLMLWGVISRERFIEQAERVMRRIETLQVPLADMPCDMEQFANYVRGQDVNSQAV